MLCRLQVTAEHLIHTSRGKRFHPCYTPRKPNSLTIVSGGKKIMSELQNRKPRLTQTLETPPHTLLPAPYKHKLTVSFLTAALLHHVLRCSCSALEKISNDGSHMLCLIGSKTNTKMLAFRSHTPRSRYF